MAKKKETLKKDVKKELTPVVEATMDTIEIKVEDNVLPTHVEVIEEPVEVVDLTETDTVEMLEDDTVKDTKTEDIVVENTNTQENVIANNEVEVIQKTPHRKTYNEMFGYSWMGYGYTE